MCTISSVVYGPIGTKLGREVEDGHRKDLAGPVSMATIMFQWEPWKTVFGGVLGLIDPFLGVKVGNEGEKNHGNSCYVNVLPWQQLKSSYEGVDRVWHIYVGMQ